MSITLKSSYEGKTVVVTGGAGYIGSALIDKLKKFNCQIIRTSRTKGAPIAGIQDKILDLKSKESWIQIVSSADIVFHLAGNTSIPFAEENVDNSLLSNLLPIANLIYASKELKSCPKVVYASTATVYGMTDTLPVSEEVIPSPVSVYDLHKLYAEQHLTMANNQGIISAKSLRLANVYGPSLSESHSRDRGILSRITKACIQGDEINAYGGGNYLRDYIYIDDVVNAFSIVLKNEKKISNKFIEFQVGNGNSVSIKNLMIVLKNLTKSTSLLNFGKVPHIEGEIMDSKANNNDLLNDSYKVICPIFFKSF